MLKWFDLIFSVDQTSCGGKNVPTYENAGWANDYFGGVLEHEAFYKTQGNVKGFMFAERQ